MVVVIAGKLSNKTKTKIISLNETVKSENAVEFEIGIHNTIKPGKPQWANYIKGCIAHFMCKINFIHFFIQRCFIKGSPGNI